jgi:bla regulator protein blaR1
VLATDIEDTDYAKLLVGVARHECRGLLIGAHGVAPARNSLSRRVKRVLDGAVKRAPGGWRWGSAAAFFAAGMSVPVAALNLVPATSPSSETGPLVAHAQAQDSYYPETLMEQAPLAPAQVATSARIAAETAASASRGGTIEVSDGRTVLRSPDGATITVGPPDESGRRRTVIRSSSREVIEIADASAVPGLAATLPPPPPAPPRPSRPPRPPKSAIDRAIEMKAVGVTPEYVAAIRAAAPQLKLEHRDLVQLKAVGVTPAFVQELNQLGYRNLRARDISGAYAVGVRADYIRALAAAGYNRLPLRKVTEMRAVGVTAADIERFRRAGFANLDADRLVELKALGVTPEELRAIENSSP